MYTQTKNHTKVQVCLPFLGTHIAEHVNMYTCMHFHNHAHTYTLTHIYACMHTYTCLHECMHACMHSHTHTHTHTDTHTHVNTHTHTHTCAWTHTHMLTLTTTHRCQVYDYLGLKTEWVMTINSRLPGMEEGKGYRPWMQSLGWAAEPGWVWWWDGPSLDNHNTNTTTFNNKAHNKGQYKANADDEEEENVRSSLCHLLPPLCPSTPTKTHIQSTKSQNQN